MQRLDRGRPLAGRRRRPSRRASARLWRTRNDPDPAWPGPPATRGTCGPCRPRQSAAPGRRACPDGRLAQSAGGRPAASGHRPHRHSRCCHRSPPARRSRRRLGLRHRGSPPVRGVLPSCRPRRPGAPGARGVRAVRPGSGARPGRPRCARAASPTPGQSRPAAGRPPPGRLAARRRGPRHAATGSRRWRARRSAPASRGPPIRAVPPVVRTRTGARRRTGRSPPRPTGRRRRPARSGRVEDGAWGRAGNPAGDLTSGAGRRNPRIPDPAPGAAPGAGANNPESPGPAPMISGRRG